MAREWYYMKNGDTHGPITGTKLKVLALAGRLLPTDLVWKEGMSGFKPARKVQGLFAKALPKPPVVNVTRERETEPTEVLDVVGIAKQPRNLFGEALEVVGVARQPRGKVFTLLAFTIAGLLGLVTAGLLAVGGGLFLQSVLDDGHKESWADELPTAKRRIGSKDRSAAARRELFATIRRMEGPVAIHFEQFIQDKESNVHLSWNMLDEVFAPGKCTPETMAAYHRWRAAILAESE
jgi:hypothetical protein